MRGRAIIVLAVAVLAAAATPLCAQSYPPKTVTFVVPAAPGGVVDFITRALGQRLGEAWGRQVVVENKPGATNQIAAEYVAHAAPDGSALLVTPEATFVINPVLFARLPYDAAKDFVPVSGLIRIQQALIVNPALPAKTVPELIALAKARPGTLNYGTYGVGSTGHLNMAMFERQAGLQLTAVHYKGATPALTDVMAGHIQMMFISVGSAVEPAHGGKVRLLATGGSERLPRLPDIPTVTESGLPGFEAVSWFGLFAPAGTPVPVVETLNAEVQRIFADPGFRRAVLDPQFFEPMTSTPQEFAAFIKADAATWARNLRMTNIKIE